jgi:Caspase domain
MADAACAPHFIVRLIWRLVLKRSMAALVIGNSDYPDGNDLNNPVNDAADLGAKLKGYGFDVTIALDCTAKDMDKRLKSFRKLLESNEVALFFFAGHGMQIDGANYLMAVDTDMETEDDAKHSSLSLDKVVDTMAKSKAGTRIIILDACRSNPWERNWHRSLGVRGLASVYAPKGTIIGFATSPGEVAYDGVGRNGTYTSALLEHIDAPDCSIETMFKRVRNTVAASSKGKQTSWEHTSLSGEFYFNLSLGNLIDEYDGTALADRLFVTDPARKSHQIIAGLKTHNWYKQNPALALLDDESVKKMAKNSLFVIGRNIYQAACGSASGPGEFLRDFMNATSGYSKDNRKSILDGILFEIFFDKDGKPRERAKRQSFEEVFELQRHEELKESFEFIAESLTVTNGDFYAIPGKGHELAVTVSTKKKKDGIVVDAIYIGGADVLRIEDEYAAEELRYSTTDPADLSDRLRDQLFLPARLLTVSFTPKEAESTDELLIPRHWTVRKQSASQKADA